jgi:hypothetical protein
VARPLFETTKNKIVPDEVSKERGEILRKSGNLELKFRIPKKGDSGNDKVVKKGD